MRRLLTMICCLVLATTLVARGGGMVTCPDGKSCCAMPSRFSALAATTAPTTSPSCCDETDAPKPKPVTDTHEKHAAVPEQMPCCASVAWTPAPPEMPLVGEALVRDAVTTSATAHSAAAEEPATPPPRSIG